MAEKPLLYTRQQYLTWWLREHGYYTSVALLATKEVRATYRGVNWIEVMSLHDWKDRDGVGEGVARSIANTIIES